MTDDLCPGRSGSTVNRCLYQCRLQHGVKVAVNRHRWSEATTCVVVGDVRLSTATMDIVCLGNTTGMYGSHHTGV